jgi:hypothetical protein
MRIAIIIHGEPRFCEEFDKLINSVKDVEQVDWFFYLWSETDYPTDEQIIHEREHNPYAHTYGFNVVAPNWRSVNRDWAMQKLRDNLPAHHNIVRAEFVDHQGMEFPPIEGRQAVEISIKNICKNWYSLMQVDLYRQEYEKQNNFTYNLVIRSRPDIAVISELDFESLLGGVTGDPQVVFIPSNHQCGYDGIHFCDLYAIASSRNMSIYSDVFNQAWKHNLENNVIFHGETMLARHLQLNGLRFVTANLHIGLRSSGQDHAEPGGIYISNYGRWE